ncbi:hypothetical protein BpHYR1_011363 [Brachionus plicatilis]|uniref:Uncharacterized protein n=1 Tax=Brachionus plicatilis TaxID=10195 RepID=A0A3M7SLW7_BRAPC|nr:hypothetical protein BpHYR1_011363 [Brachionus plicatilis]
MNFLHFQFSLYYYLFIIFIVESICFIKVNCENYKLTDKFVLKNNKIVSQPNLFTTAYVYKH